MYYIFFYLHYFSPVHGIEVSKTGTNHNYLSITY